MTQKRTRMHPSAEAGKRRVEMSEETKKKTNGSDSLDSLVSQHEPEVYAFPKGAITEAKAKPTARTIPRTAKKTNPFVQFLKDGFGFG